MNFTKDFLQGSPKRNVSVKETGGNPYGGRLTLLPQKPAAGKTDTQGEAKWFQKGAFEDGYQFGDVTKTAIATGRDLGENLLTGVAGMGEKALDALAYAAPYIAQGQYYQNGGVYQPLEFQKAQNQAFEQNKKLVADFIAKDLYDEEAVARTVMGSDTFEKVTGIDTQKNSVLGEKADALAQSGGQLLGTAGLKLLGIPAELTIFATSFGSEAENALNQGASMEEAGISAAVSAGAEVLTEKFSDGIKLIGGKTLTEAMKKKLAQAISNKTARTLIGLGLDTAGEGFEEVLTEAVSALGQKLTYASEKEMKELLTKESLWDAFIGGAVMGNVSGSGKAVTGNNLTGWDGREVVTAATGPSVTVGGKKYQFLGYDAKGVPVYEDARKVQEAAEAANKTGEGGQDTQKSQEGIENREQYDKMVSEIKAAGKFAENAKVHIPPQNVVLEVLAFDDNHINGERGHNVSREMAESWIRESKASVTVWNGRFERYYGPKGVVYVDKLKNNIRTAYSWEEFDETTKMILEVLKHHGY